MSSHPTTTAEPAIEVSDLRRSYGDLRAVRGVGFIWFDERGGWRPYALSGVLGVLAIVLTVADRPSWGFLFT